MKSKTVYQQELTEEFQTEVQREPVLSNVNELGFIEQGTGKHQSNIIYGVNGICPCECSTQHKEPFKILEESSGS